MTVKELIQELQKYHEDLKVFTKKTDAMGTIGNTFHVYEDMYSWLGVDIPCVIVSDSGPRTEE